MRKGKFKIAKVTEITGWRTVGAKLLDYSKNVVMEWDKKPGSPEAPELF